MIKRFNMLKVLSSTQGYYPILQYQYINEVLGHRRSPLKNTAFVVLEDLSSGLSAYGIKLHVI